MFCQSLDQLRARFPIFKRSGSGKTIYDEKQEAIIGLEGWKQHESWLGTDLSTCTYAS